MKRWVVLFLIMSLMMAVFPADAAAAGNLLDLLEGVPRSLFSDGALSFVDYEALAAVQPGARAPESAAGSRDHLESPAGKAYLLALQGASAGYANLLMYLGLAEDMVKVTGLDPFKVKASLALGQEGRKVFLRGPVEEAALEAALLAQGYQRMEGKEGLAWWCEGGNCGKGLKVDFARRDPAFLFGGDLGRFWPVALKGGVVFSAAEGPDFQTYLEGEGPLLTEDEGLRAMLKTLDIPEVQGQGRLVQAVTAARAGGLLSFAQLVAEDALFVVVSLPWQGVGSKEELGRAKAFVEEALLGNGRPLLGEVERLGGRLLQPSLVEAGDTRLLSLVFRFPGPEQAARENPAAPISLPFQILVGQLYRNQLGWLPSP